MRRALLPIIFIFIFLCSGFSDCYAASIEKLSGLVELRRDKQDYFIEALVGQIVKSGDTLRTGIDGKIMLHLEDGSIMSFSGDSEFMLGSEINGEDHTVLGTFFRGVGRALFKKRVGSKIITPNGILGIRGTDITFSHNGEVGFYFLDEGGVNVEVNGMNTMLDAGHMTASYSSRKPLPPFPFTKSAALSDVRDKLSTLTSVEIPSSLKNHAQLNEILARWIINYAHYLADAGKHDAAETALLIAENLTGKQSVKGEILLQIGGLHFYHLNDVQGALGAYRKIIREYHETEHYENALYGAIRCFMTLNQDVKAREYVFMYMARYPDGKYRQVLDCLKY